VSLVRKSKAQGSKLEFSDSYKFPTEEIVGAQNSYHPLNLCKYHLQNGDFSSQIFALWPLFSIKQHSM